MNKVRKLFAASSRKRALLARSAFIVGTVVAGVPLLGFSKVRTILESLSGRGQTLEETSDEQLLADMVWAVNVASHNIPGANTCLIRALSMKTLLTAHGIKSDLVIGVRCKTTMEQDMSAHAWVEHAGKLLIGESSDPHSLVRLGCIAFE